MSAGKTKQVVLIEDDLTISRLLTAIMRRMGHTAFVAATGAEGQALLQRLRGEVDLIILDYSLPDTPCRGMLADVRRLAPTGRVLLTSGYNLDMLDGVQPEQIDGFVQKPFTVHDVQLRVEELLDK